MIIIQCGTKNLIDALMLHDAEVSEIKINYNKHTVSIPLRLESRIKALLKFENVKYSDVNIFEPWGEGIYIYEVTADNDRSILEKVEEVKINTEYFNTSILLNSGDRINIISSMLIYTENDIDN